jgi:hypothetical protein
MPWIVRESTSPQAALRRRLRRWAYDNSQSVIALGIGSACVAAVVVALRLTGFL